MTLRVVVLGAGGFIGRRVVSALHASDWASPVAAGHRSPLQAGEAETLRFDATDAAALAPAIAGADAVVNCIAGSAATMVAAAHALFGAARRAPHPPRIVHLSTMAVYGAAVGTVDETAALRGDVGAYSAAKVEAERIAQSCSNVVTLRPGCVYGPGSTQWSERVAQWLTSRRVGDLGAAGDGCCNLVYVDDVVAAIVAAVRLPGIEGQAFNLGSPAPLTWNEYFLAFARALGAVPIRRVSRRALMLETRLWAPPLKIAQIAARVSRLRRISIPPPIPPSLLRAWSQALRLDVRKAEQGLELAWTPAATGLRETAAQLRAAGVA